VVEFNLTKTNILKTNLSQIVVQHLEHLEHFFHNIIHIAEHPQWPIHKCKRIPVNYKHKVHMEQVC
jgi:hypothetical protein